MKNQALFLRKIKANNKCHLLQFLFGQLRVKSKLYHVETSKTRGQTL